MKHTPIFTTTVNKGNDIRLKKEHEITFLSSSWMKKLNYLSSGITISKNKFYYEKPLGGSEDEIIQQIHGLRFNPQTQNFVITGGHFSQLYVRNLGIFFNALLDSRIPSTIDDWIQRQRIALQTVALDLEVFKNQKKRIRPIVPVKGSRYSAMNIYTLPSDSLFAILYTLIALQDSSFINEIFPRKDEEKSAYDLQTQKSAKDLFNEYRASLQFLLDQYKSDILDKKTGLVKETIYLASARDGIKRQSSFYDNVICWATFSLAKRLGLVDYDNAFFAKWKEKIIRLFWNENEGIFIDDLSDESKQNTEFSADSLIVISTSFLDLSIKGDREKLERIVLYIKKNKLDQPFPLRYSSHHHPKKLHNAVRYFAPTYMTKSIWSHWGMEYIKTLILLSKHNSSLLIDAKTHLQKYTNNIERYGGYPELYDLKGKILQHFLYKGVLHNGWVINYEQTKMLLKNYSKK